MRPKKRILLIDPDEERTALRRFVLEQNAFAMADDMIGPDLILLNSELASRLPGLRQCHRDIPIFLIGHSSENDFPDSVLAHDIAMSDLLKAVKTGCARKRGPKKASVAA